MVTCAIESYLCCSYLSYELHYEVHHQLGVLVEDALPQLVHHTLAEVEDVVDQRLVAAATTDCQGGVLTWVEEEKEELGSTFPSR